VAGDGDPDDGNGARWRATALGGAAAVGWLTLFALWLWPAGGGVAALLGGAVPLGLIGGATLAALALQDLRAEAAALRQERDRLRAALAAPPETPKLSAAARPFPPADPAPRPAAMPAGRRPAQAALPLGPDTPPAPLTLPDLIRALHFPETPEDRAGLRAMQRALRDHKARLVVQAAQDMLTLLSQDGIYMDDLAPDRAPPALWRRFAAGERRAEVMAVGGIGDPRALELCRARLRDNTVWRDTAHHFLRRFDQMLGGVVPDLDDAGIEALSETRSARAFMLVGRAAEVFGPDPARTDTGAGDSTPSR